MKLGIVARAHTRARMRRSARGERRRPWRRRIALTSVLLLAATATFAPAAASSAFSTGGQAALVGADAAMLRDRVVRLGGAVDGQARAVLLIHGWLSTSLPSDVESPAFAQSPFDRPVLWQDGSAQPVGRGQSASLQQRLEALPGVGVYAFDYSANSSGWVGSNGSAGNLGDAIRAISASVGGAIDIVTHSMGGLALRYALAASPDLAGLIDRVVTVGTPTEGSDIANVAVGIAGVIRASMSTIPVLQNLVLPWIGAVCNFQLASDARAGCDLPPVIRTGIAALGPGGIALRAGSADIADLPPWPAGMHVEAVAGAAVLAVPVVADATIDINLGDGLVAQGSAVAQVDSASVVTCRTQLEPGLDGLLSILSGEVAAPPFGGACGHDALFANLAVVDAVLGALDLPGGGTAAEPAPRR